MVCFITVSMPYLQFLDYLCFYNKVFSTIYLLEVVYQLCMFACSVWLRCQHYQLYELDRVPEVSVLSVVCICLFRDLVAEMSALSVVWICQVAWGVRIISCVYLPGCLRYQFYQLCVFAMVAEMSVLSDVCICQCGWDVSFIRCVYLSVWLRCQFYQMYIFVSVAEMSVLSLVCIFQGGWDVRWGEESATTTLPTQWWNSPALSLQGGRGKQYPTGNRVAPCYIILYFYNFSTIWILQLWYFFKFFYVLCLFVVLFTQLIFVLFCAHHFGTLSVFIVV